MQPMTPPKGYEIRHRPTCQPRQDEVQLLRDARGRVLAAIEAWTPEPPPESRPS